MALIRPPPSPPQPPRNQPRSADNIHIASIPGRGTKWQNERKTELSTSDNQLYML